MLTQTTINTAPEGLSSISTRRGNAQAQSHVDHSVEHDDGLVHGHHWHSTQAPRLGRRRTLTVRHAPRTAQHHDHDDGLVHSHSWAVSSPDR